LFAVAGRGIVVVVVFVGRRYFAVFRFGRRFFVANLNKNKSNLV
jgi:hypothetical protein